MASAITNLGYIQGVNLGVNNFALEDLAAAESVIAGYIQANYPTLDVSPGTSLYDLVVRPQAVVYLTNYYQQQALQATNSLAAIQANPSLASTAVLNNILSNFLITPQPGVAVTGTVMVNVSAQAEYLVPAGTTFTTGSGLTYTNATDVNATPTPELATDSPLYTTAGGNQWYFLVPVTATAVGTQYILNGQTAFTMTPSIFNLVSSFAFGGFDTGSNAQTDAQLIAAIPDALSVKNLVSRAAIRSQLTQQFPNIVSIGVTGFSDPELRRGAGNVFGIKTGGLADIWVRTASYPVGQSFVVTATKISTSSAGDVFQFVVPNTLYPGNYFVSAVTDPNLPANTLGTYEIISQTPSLPASVPHVYDAVPELVYSRYQNSTVQILVPPASGGTSVYPSGTQAFNIQVMGVPNIADIQEYVSAADTRPAGTDYVVKAAVPCFVSFSPITVYGLTTVTSGAIQTAVFTWVNSLAAGQPLKVDDIVLAIRNVPGVTSVKLPLVMAAQIMAPDGTVINMQSQSQLDIPVIAASQVSPETTVFYVSADNIPVNAVLSNA